MQKLFCALLCAFLALPLSSLSQGYLTQYTPEGGNPGGVSSAGDSETSQWTTAFSGPATSNVYSNTVLIPFSFEFFGTPVDALKAAPNGFLTFDTLATALPEMDEPLPSTSLPPQAIAAFWDDFANVASTDIIRWKVFGSAPNRQLWIKWHSMTVGVASYAYFSVVLEEGSNNIYVVDQWSSMAGGPARVGLQLDPATFVVGNNDTTLTNNGSGNSDNDFYTFAPLVNGEDARATGLTLSAEAEAGCGGATVPVTLDLSNGGTANLAGLVATLEVDGMMVALENIPGSLASGTTSSYTFSATADLTAPGPHTVRAWVTSGMDVDLSNDTASISVITEAAATLPLPTVDFTGYTGSNLPTVFPGWFEANDFGVPDSGSSSWFRDDWLNDGSSPNGDAARINLSFTSDEEWIIGPKFTVDPNTQLRFDLGLTTGGGTGPASFGSDDYLQVLISTDCGQSYTALRTFDASTPVSNTGQLEVVGLNAFTGQDVTIAFYADEGSSSDPSVDLFLDNIQILVPTPIDLAAAQLEVGAGCLGSAETITASLINLGTVVNDFATDSVIWTLQIDGPIPQTFTDTINTGSLGIGDTLPLTLTTAADLSGAGDYDLTFSISSANDGTNANDTVLVSATNAPLFTMPVGPVDFTGFTGSNLETLFPGWFEGEGATVPDMGGSVWDDDDFANDPNHPNGTAARLNLYTTSRDEWIVSPKFLVEPGAVLTYDLAVTSFFGTSTATFGSDDTFQVLISIDCGLSYTALQTFDASSSISNTGQLETVDLSGFAGQEAIIAFFGKDGPIDDPEDYNIYIDNILVQVPPDLDLEVTSLEVPEPNFCYGLEPIEAVLTNRAPDSLFLAQDTFLVTTTISGPIPQTFLDTLAMDTLAPDSALTLINDGDFSVGGSYTITLFISNPDDGAAFNDTLSTTLTVASFTAPYQEDFDGLSEGTTFPAGWQSLSTTSSGSDFIWEIESGTTTSSNTGPSEDNTTGNGNYIYTEASDGSQGDSAILITPCIDLSALSNPQMDFFYHMFGEDMGTFEVLIDDGSSVASVFTRVGEQDTAFSDTDPWNPASVSLSAYAGQTIRVIFLGERGPSFEGDMSVDDLFIYEPTGIDLVTSGADVPDNGCTFEVDSTITVDLFNNKSTAQDLSVDSVIVVADVSGVANFQVRDTVNSGTLAAGDTLSVALTADFQTPGQYEVLIFTSSLTDENPYNDTLVTNRTTLPLYVAPYTEDFEGSGYVNSTTGTDPGEINFDWMRNRLDPVAWYPNDGSTPSTSTGPDGDHTTGTGRYMYTETSGFISTGEDTAVLMSSCIDLDTLSSPVLSFWYHMHGDDMGTLFVEVENEQGDVATIWSLSGEQQGDNPDPYLQAFAPLNDFVGDTVMLRFVGVYGGDFNGDIAIDDISVDNAAADAVSVLRLASPALPGCVGAQEPLAVTVFNLGPNAIDFSTDTLLLTASIDDGTNVQLIEDTITSGTVASFDSLVHLFSANANFTNPGEYTLEVSINFGPDQSAGDDALSFDLVRIPAVALPTAVDFTGYTSSNLDAVFPGWYEGEGFLTPDTTSSSQWVEDDFANDPNSPNGSAAGINLFTTGDEDWIVSPPFVATDSTLLTYEIAVTDFGNQDPENLGSDDEVVVFISTDCGGSYQRLRTYDATTPISNTGQSEVIDLTAFAGQKVSIGFWAYEGTVNDPEDYDVFLDNIFIGTPDTANVAALELVAPMDQACGDSLMMGSLSLRNLGIFSVDTLPLTISVTGPTGVTTLNDTLFGPFDFGVIDSLMFGPFDTYAGGTYAIQAIAGLSGDQEAANDTIRDTVFIRSLTPVNVLPIDSICAGDSAMLVVDDTLYDNSEFVWFEAGTQVATGDTFVTPPLSAPTTYTVRRVDQGTNAGCETEAASITVEQLPVITAGFAVDSTGDLLASFEDASTNADSVRYLFGDGNGSSMPNPVHMYDTAGTYEVCQVAFGECGPDTTCQTVVIVCEPAVGGFAVDSTGDLFVALSDTSLKADSVQYDFGDGTSSDDFNPTHMYDTAGVYIITQVAYHFCGNDTTEIQVNITCAAAQPGFSFDQTDNLTITFTNTSQNADSVVLDLGDGNQITFTSQDTAYEYASADVYEVCLTAYNLCGPVETCQNVEVINTSLSKLFSGSLSLYPNPTQGLVDLRLDLTQSANVAVEVTDMRGRSLFQQSLGQQVGASEQRFDLSHLSEGMYLFKVQIGEQVAVRKLRIE